MREIELVLLLLVLVTALTLVARRFTFPYPIVMVLGGLLLSQIPALPAFELPPELVFFVFLPPLLFAGGYFTSLRDFKANLRPIFLLAFGLVLFGGIAVGIVVGRAGAWILARIRDTAIAVMVTLLAPFAAYLSAESIGVSGVLATVVGGLFARSWLRQSSSDTRVVAFSAWQM